MDTDAGTLLLIRHGRTEWARSGRHTGRTDVPLDAEGERAATALAEPLRRWRFAQVRVSPLQRAGRTAELAGLARPVVDDDLAEWDYGADEGLTRAQIVAARDGRPWTVFADGVRPGGPGQGPGEGLEQVAARARAVLARVAEPLTRGPVALVGHGHALRVLAAVHLGLPPQTAALLELSPAAVCVLGTTYDRASLRAWNVADAAALP